VSERADEVVVNHEPPEPKASHLIWFGVGLLVTIVSIIVVAAVLGA
jgi:hypothetical protein